MKSRKSIWDRMLETGLTVDQIGFLLLLGLVVGVVIGVSLAKM